jgi:hypothetical protein
MARKKEARVTLFAAILEAQYEGLRTIAFREKKSLAEVTREAIDIYLQTKHPQIIQEVKATSLVKKRAASSHAAV